jgi:myo-inositol-1(or 4)-monophosphatase/deoxyribonuclease-2
VIPLVVAHRTCPRDARENSLEGIAFAARAGADVVEVDARRSRDGTAVLSHDPLLLRVQHVPLPVRWLRDAQLARLRVPTLGEALEAAGASGIRVAIDTKDAGAADAVLAAVRETGAADRVLPWSQHMPAVRTFVRALPDAQVGLLRDTFDSAGHDRFLADAQAIGARAVSAHQDAATPEFIAAARERGIAVFTWFQRADKQTDRLADLVAAGLAGVVTDWPAHAREVLGNRE